jgi:hypothetical protein
VFFLLRLYKFQYYRFMLVHGPLAFPHVVVARAGAGPALAGGSSDRVMKSRSWCARF